MIGILLFVRLLPAGGKRDGAKLDGVGAVLSALGLALIVLGVLQASTWGWLQPRNSPVDAVRLLPDPVHGRRGRRRARALRDLAAPSRARGPRAARPPPAVRRSRPLRSGLAMFLFQNLILMGIFFAIPLYLQIVQGFDAFETGVRMLPVSVTLFVTALAGSRLARALSRRGDRPRRPRAAARRAALCCSRRSSPTSRPCRSRSPWPCSASAWA